jgi:hypothetical protein
MAKAPPLLRPLRCGGCGCATVTLAVPPTEPCDAPNYIVATCTECGSPTIISIRSQMVIDWPSLHGAGIEDGDGCLAQY